MHSDLTKILLFITFILKFTEPEAEVNLPLNFQ